MLVFACLPGLGYSKIRICKKSSQRREAQTNSVEKQIVLEVDKTSSRQFKKQILALIKRGLDFFFAFFGLLLLAPVFLSIAIRIKRDSPGPVFYQGKRMGRHQKPFYILKFRTMTLDAEQSPGAPVTACDDERVTKFGRYLRDTKLNELPQLWNVLIGEMSIVGPRPEDYDLALTWPEDARREITSIRPGITSPASVLYRDEEQLLKGAGFMDEYLVKILPDKLRLDRQYVQHINLLTDADVVATTIFTLLPRIRGRQLDERMLFGGPVLMFFRRIVPWFLLDVFVASISVGLSGIVWRISTVINLGVPVFLILTLAIAVLISLINALMGLQKVSWVEASPAYVVDIGISVLVTMGLLWTINRLILTEPRIPFSLYWLIGITTYLGLVAVRYRDRLISSLAYRWLLFRGSKASFAERILIVGAGRLGELASWLIQRSAYSSILGVIGFVDDDPHKRDLNLGGIKVLGSTSDIPKLVEKYNVSIIFFAISKPSGEESNRISKICKETGAKLVVLPDLVNTLEKSFEGIGINGN